MKDLPKMGTVAAKQYFQTSEEISRMYYFLLSLVGNSERVATTAHEVLVDTEKDPEIKKKMITEWETRKGPVDELKKNRQVFLEMIVVRNIENFIGYLSSILYQIFIVKPETLKSSEKIEIEKVLEHTTIDSFVKEIAERKVDSLTYSSFYKIVIFFKEKFGLKLAEEGDLTIINEYIEIRNISVHNRCVINKRFIDRLNLSDDMIGKKRKIFIDDIDKLLPILSTVVKSMDHAINKKFKVPRIRFNKK